MNNFYNSCTLLQVSLERKVSKMKFGHLFEFHKIPDWYTEYVHYKELKLRIDEFKSLKKMGQVKQLKGYYMINKRGQIYSIDFIKDYKKRVNSREGGAANDKSARLKKRRQSAAATFMMGSQEMSKGIRHSALIDENQEAIKKLRLSTNDLHAKS